MQTKDRWKNAKTSVYNLGYHLIWCPKYRKNVLIGNVEDTLKTLIRQKTDELKCEICAMEIMPDHVHLFVKAPPTIAVHFLVRQIKGYTARTLREQYPHLKRKMPSMWTRSYYAESVGHISEDNIKKYIEQQKNK